MLFRSPVRSRLSQPAMQALSTSGSLSAAQVVSTGPSSARSAANGIPTTKPNVIIDSRKVLRVFDSSDCDTFTLRLHDRLGDNGIVVAAIARAQGEDLCVDSWVMSCRVLGRRVEEALRRLTPDHRRAVVEVYYQGRTAAELAAELGVPAATVRSRLFYGLRALRLSLDELGWDDG